MITPGTYTFRLATENDLESVYDVYEQVARIKGGFARSPEEITLDYVRSFMEEVRAKEGVQMVAVHEVSNRVVGEIHCFKIGLEVFEHLLSHLTMAVHPKFQGRGIGKILFSKLLEFVSLNRKDVMRIELIARESNVKAIEMYKKLGFREEGRMENRIKSSVGTFEDDIPMAWMNKMYMIDKDN